MTESLSIQQYKCKFLTVLTTETLLVVQFIAADCSDSNRDFLAGGDEDSRFSLPLDIYVVTSKEEGQNQDRFLKNKLVLLKI